MELVHIHQYKLLLFAEYDDSTSFNAHSVTHHQFFDTSHLPCIVSLSVRCSGPLIATHLEQ